MRTTLEMDEQSREVMNILPRNISLSSLFRVMVKTIGMTDAEFKKAEKSDPEIQKVKAYLKPRLQKLMK
jgi:hypothetical protein